MRRLILPLVLLVSICPARAQYAYGETYGESSRSKEQRAANDQAARDDAARAMANRMRRLEAQTRAAEETANRAEEAAQRAAQQRQVIVRQVVQQAPQQEEVDAVGVMTPGAWALVRQMEAERAAAVQQVPAQPAPDLVLWLKPDGSVWTTSKSGERRRFIDAPTIALIKDVIARTEAPAIGP